METQKRTMHAVLKVASKYDKEATITLFVNGAIVLNALNEKITGKDIGEVYAVAVNLLPIIAKNQKPQTK